MYTVLCSRDRSRTCPFGPHDLPLTAEETVAQRRGEEGPLGSSSEGGGCLLGLPTGSGRILGPANEGAGPRGHGDGPTPASPGATANFNGTNNSVRTSTGVTRGRRCPAWGGGKMPLRGQGVLSLDLPPRKRGTPPPTARTNPEHKRAEGRQGAVPGTVPSPCLLLSQTKDEPTALPHPAGAT